MPALELAQETGKVLKWLKNPGDAVTKGEPIVEIETDKVTVEIEAPAAGVLRDVTAQPGDVVPVGKTIALIFAAGEAGGGAGPPPAGAARGAARRRPPPPAPPAGGAGPPRPCRSGRPVAGRRQWCAGVAAGPEAGRAA